MNQKLELRQYQKDCIEKILWERQENLSGNSVCVLPTGSGKSVVIAHLAQALNEPILILQPTKEILEQNYEKLCRYVDPAQIGIYSASMDEKTIGFYTFATIQSIYKKPEFFKHFNLVIIDECHLVDPKSLGGMFSSFLRKIGSPKVIGFTATPYRMTTKYISGGDNSFELVTTIKLINRFPPNKDNVFFWQRILFNVSIQDMVSWGFLCPLEYLDKSIVEQYEIPLNKSRSEFDMDKYEEMLTEKQQEIMKAISYGQEVSKSVLIFCSSVRQAEKLSSITGGSAVVTAKTAKKERDRIINGFRNGNIKTVFNVGVLAMGFDHPALDCIILLRPTRSIGLYYQMLGRGVRIAEGKIACKIIDLTSTVRNLGRVETIRLVSGKDSGTGKYELVSEAGSWHNCELYRFTVQRKEKPPQEKLDNQGVGESKI